MPKRFSTPANSPDVNFNLSRNGIRGFTDNNADHTDNAVAAFAPQANGQTVNFDLTRNGIRGFAPIR